MAVSLFLHRMADKREQGVEQTATIVIGAIDSVVVQLHLQTLTRQGEGGIEVETGEEPKMRQEVSFSIS